MMSRSARLRMHNARRNLASPCVIDSTRRVHTCPRWSPSKGNSGKRRSPPSFPEKRPVSGPALYCTRARSTPAPAPALPQGCPAPAPCCAASCALRRGRLRVWAARRRGRLPTDKGQNYSQALSSQENIAPPWPRPPPPDPATPRTAPHAPGRKRETLRRRTPGEETRRRAGVTDLSVSRPCPGATAATLVTVRRPLRLVTRQGAPRPSAPRLSRVLEQTTLLGIDTGAQLGVRRVAPIFLR
jgi:hypothetical protein